MSKLATFSALLLLAMVTMATATTYTTITTTTIEDETSLNPKGRESQEEISHCSMYLQCETGRRPEDSLRMVVVNPTWKTKCEREHMDKCCEQLGKIEKNRRCQAIEKMVMDQGTQRMHEMKRMAQDMPGRCDMAPRQCHMQGPWF